MSAPFSELVGWLEAANGQTYPVYAEGCPGLENGKLLMCFNSYLQVAPGEEGRKQFRAKNLGPEVVPISQIAARIHLEWFEWKKEVSEFITDSSDFPQIALV